MHCASPTHPYPEFAPMLGPMAMPPQPYMMSEPMQYVPPSPMMHCSMYDAPGWNMIPMYPISPVQPLHDHIGDHYSLRFHPRKLWASHTPPSSSPAPDLAQRAVYIQNLNPASTTADLTTLLRNAGPVEQCNVTVTSEIHDTRAQAHASAIMHSMDAAQRAMNMFNGMTFMGSRIRVKMEVLPDMTRSGSWDGTMANTVNKEDEQNSTNDQISECIECGQGTNSKRLQSLNQPLVVDGSGRSGRSLEYLSTSAPT